jgi:hypothetical protein
MATELIAFTLGRTVGTDQVLAEGITATLQGVFKGRNGRVKVEIKNADLSYSALGYLTPSPTGEISKQLCGPLTYRVITRNAGCDVG